MNDEQLIQALFSKYLEDTITDDERGRLRILLDTAAADEAVSDTLRDLFQFQAEDSYNMPAADARIKRGVQEYIRRQQGRVHFLKTAWFRYAAILLLIAGTATYLYTSTSLFRRNPGVTKTHGPLQPKDIPPGGNRAILTLADGTKIMLDRAANGQLAQQGNTTVIKTAGGQLSYTLRENLEGLSPGNANPELKPSRLVPSAGLNTISTPRGGQYQIVLPDGTKVWLNTASSIRFPVTFGKKREVTVTGEAYFEVAQNMQQPFVVDVHGGSLIEVLGTSFNINSYADEENIRTTLLEGSVRVGANNKTVILKPGQQAVAASSQLTVHTADIEKAVAWKNGIFKLDNTSLKETMRQIARWYDVEVVYEGDVSDVVLGGNMSHNLVLSQIVAGLEKLGVNIRIEGRKLYVSKEQE